MDRNRLFRGAFVLGAALALLIGTAGVAAAGDWQLWIPPEGRSANPPAYEYWERYDVDEDNIVSLEDCWDYADWALFFEVEYDDDMFERVEAGICYNKVTEAIYPAVEY